MTSTGRVHLLVFLWSIAHRRKASFVTATPTRHHAFPGGSSGVVSSISMLFSSFGGTTWFVGRMLTGSGSMVTWSTGRRDINMCRSWEKIVDQLCRYPAHLTRKSFFFAKRTRFWIPRTVVGTKVYCGILAMDLPQFSNGRPE